MQWLLILTGLLTNPSEAIPLDAFRVNYRDIKIDIKYEYQAGTLGPSLHKNLWDGKPILIPADAENKLLGEWACDGDAEYYHFISAADGTEPPSPAKQPQSLYQITRVPEVEGIFDGKLLISHNLREKKSNKLIYAQSTREPVILGMGVGPFFWWRTFPLVQFLEEHFPNHDPEIKEVYRNGKHNYLEKYNSTVNKTRLQVEVFYDPSLGFLPSYARFVAAEEREMFVKEFYLMEAKQCPAGGVVPTDWFDTSFTIDGAAKVEQAAYSEQTRLRPSDSFTVGHFTTLQFTPRNTPVAMLKIDGKKYVAGGGAIAELTPRLRPLTTAAVRRALGSKGASIGYPSLGKGPQTKRSVGPTPDIEEMRDGKSQDKTNQNIKYYYMIIFTLLFSLLLWGRRRIKPKLAAICFLAVQTMTGCSNRSVGHDRMHPVVKLSAKSDVRNLLYKESDITKHIKLTVSNHGLERIKLFKADGGCVCRKIDQSAFPRMLDPGGHFTLDMELATQRKTGQQSVLLNFDTDFGSQYAPFSLDLIPENEITPSTITFSCNEGEETTFEFTHKFINPANSPPLSFELRGAEDFVLTASPGGSDPVATMEGTTFAYTDYKAKLANDKVGTFKKTIELVNKERTTVASIPVVWQRFAFLSSVPEQVLLGAQPVRVFLRCPDESVEFLKIIKTSDNVDAVISSPREVVISVKKNSRGVFSDAIEVLTSASGRPPLRIPVKRFTETKAR